MAAYGAHNPQILHGVPMGMPFGQGGVPDIPVVQQPLDTRPASQSEAARAAALLDKFSRAMLKNLTALNRWCNALMFRHQLGLARCAELQEYNRTAIDLYSRQIVVASIMRANGVPPSVVPPPQVPPLFGTKVAINLVPGSLFPTIDLQLQIDCDSRGFARSTVSAIATCAGVPQVTQADVNAAAAGTIGTPAAVPLCLTPFGLFACSVLIGLAAFALLPAAGAFFRSVLNSEGEINRMAQDTTAIREAQRQEAINNCIVAQMPTLNALPVAQRLAAAERLMARCEKLNPPVTGPPAARSPFMTIAIAASIVAVAGGGLMLGYWYFNPARSATRRAA